MKFYEIAINSVRNRSIIVTNSEMMRYYQRAIDENVEMYRSTYYYDKKILEHLGVRKTVMGFIGMQGLEKVIFDFDKKEKSDDALLEEVKYFIRNLLDNWGLPEEAVKPWFSGRGYHVVCPDFFGFEPQIQLNKIVKATIAEYFPDVDLSIYDSNSLIRVANTINAKVRRYKIQLTVRELNRSSAADIIKLSEENRKLTDIPEYDPEDVIIHRNKIVQPKAKIAEASVTEVGKILCMQKAYKLGPTEGERHHTMLRMISTYKRQGVPYEGILAMMKSWAIGMDNYEIEKCVKDTFDANNGEGYNYGCQDPIMKKHCDSKCVFYKSQNLLPIIKSMGDAEKNFVTHVRTDYTKKSIDLMKIFGIKTGSYLIQPKQNLLFFGDGGLGKTAFMQNIAVKAKHLRTLYFNFEIDTDLLYRRFVQIEYGMNKETAYQYYTTNNNSASNNLSHISIVDKQNLDVKELYQTIEAVQPELIIFDTIMKLRIHNKEGLSKDAIIADLTNAISKRYNTIVCSVHHIPKSESKGLNGTPNKLTQHSGKGANDLENMCDHVLMLEGNDQKNFRTIRSGKARDESKANIPFQFNWDNFRYTYIGA